MAPKKLKSCHKLISKGQSSDALLKKLKALQSELEDLDQDAIDVNSLSSVCEELISETIISHKHRGVKAYAACCIADILRLYAPDAPLTQDELRDCFQFFFQQLSANLKGADVAYYIQYFHLLECLATVKSVVLVCDLPHAEDLMLGIFRDLFAIVRRDLPNKIELFMTEILVAIINECSSISADILEIIMAQFMDKSTPAYRLAVNVFNETADKLQRNVALYFTDIIVSNSQEEDFEQIHTAYDLIKRLHASCPDILPSVIPQLAEGLHADAPTLRAITTQVLGEMFSDNKNGPQLARNHPSTLNAWLGRRVDKSPVVRLKFVEGSKGLCSASAELSEAIEKAYRSQLLDPDEKVRVAVCKVYSQLNYETALHHVSEKQLRAIAQRVADKKSMVRFEAANSLGRLYALAYPEIENNDVTAIQKFAWIPDHLILMSSSVLDCRAVVEQVFSDHILPLPSYTPNSNFQSQNANGAASSTTTSEVDEIAWTDRLLNVMRYLSEKAVNNLVTLSNLKPTRPTQLDYFIDACILYNGGVIPENEEQRVQKFTRVIDVVSVNFSDSIKLKEDLRAFAKINELRLYKLLRMCLNVDTDLKQLVKAQHEFLERLSQTSPSLLPSLTSLLRRGSLHLLNASSIPSLLYRVQKAHGTSLNKPNVAAGHAYALLGFVAKYCPRLFKGCVEILVTAVDDGKNRQSVGAALKALASLSGLDGGLVPMESSMVDVIKNYALGSDSHHSKFATRIFAFCGEHEVCDELVETVTDSLGDVPEDQLLAHLVLLAQFARYMPDTFEQKSDVITSFLLKRLLMIPDLAPEDLPIDEDGNVEEWEDDSQISSNVEAKIVAIKLLRYRSMAHATEEDAIGISTPTMKMLASVLDHNGSLGVGVDGIQEDPRVLSRMRLQAGVSLLYLSTIPAYAEALAPRFLRLALSIQDSCFNVRLAFLQKLLPLLSLRKLPPKFNLILFLTAHDPDEEIKRKASAFVTTLLKKLPPNLKTENFEYIFIRLLHLLAHHPDFSSLEQSAITDISKYVQLYLELVGSEQAISLLYHLASKGKTVRDAESSAQSENLYVMCEIAQELIKLRAQHHNWTIPTYPGKVKLPSDILRPHPNAEIANKIAKRTFLPAEASQWLERAIYPKDNKERAKRKAAGAGTNEQAKRSRRQRNKSDSDEDDNDKVQVIYTDAAKDYDADNEEELGVEKKLG